MMKFVKTNEGKYIDDGKYIVADKIVEFSPIASYSVNNGKRTCTAIVEISTVDGGVFTAGYWEAFSDKENENEDDLWIPDSKKFEAVKERLDIMLRNFLDGLADVGSPENPYADTFVMFWHEDERKLQEALQECVESGVLPDWNNIPIGSSLMVRNSIDDPWIYAEFIGIADDGSFEVSFPYKSPAETHYYKYAKYLVE